MANTGSWLGLPDFGLTEKLGGLISGGKTTDLSDAITGNYGAQPQQTPPPQTPPIGPNQQQQRTVRPSTPTIPASNPPVQNSIPSVDDAQAALMREIDNLGNQFNSFDAQAQGNLASGRDLALQSIDTQADQNKRQTTSAYEDAMELAKTQKDTTEKTRVKAEAENVRTFNQLNQKYLAQFGLGSSAGLFLGEIVTSEFLRNQGSNREKYDNSIQKINAYERSSLKTFNDANTKLMEDVDLGRKQIWQDYNDKLLQLANNRLIAEQGRSQLKIQYYNDAINYARQLAAFQFTEQEQYKTWFKQQQDTMQNAVVYAQTLRDQQSDNPFVQYDDSYSTSGGSQGSVDYLAAYRPRATRDDEDYLTPWA